MRNHLLNIRKLSVDVPYYAVIFTSKRTSKDDGYSEMAERMVELAQQQEGFLGVESVRDEIGITVSYWKSIDAIKAWKENSEHKLAQKKGVEEWYESYSLRVCKVESEFLFEK